MLVTTLLDTLLRSSREATVVLDRYNRICVVNEAFAREFDDLLAPAPPKPGVRLLHSPSLLAHLERARQQKLTHDTFELVDAFDGPVVRRLLLRLTQLPTWGEEAGPLIVLVCAEQPMAETGLPAAFAAKTESLIQSQKMEIVGRLTGSIAHDFNNLLTAILGGAEMLRANPSLDAEAQKDVDEIVKAGSSAASLTSKLVSFARKQAPQTIVLDVNETLRSLQGILRRLIGRRIAFDIEFADRPALVTADPAEIEQILLNLAINARDAMTDGGRVLVRVDFADGDGAEHGPAGGCVRLTVEDTGCGMDQETLPRIFEPFFTLKEPGRGSGLGLATVHEIVQQSGGSISVRSAPGQGTTFELFLPASRADDPAGEAIQQGSTDT